MKLGLFVVAGLLFLVLMLYMIGKNESLFGSNYELKVKVKNAQGLVAGNNVRFSGIETGTVKRIKIIKDTVIEIVMIIDTKMKGIIRKNSVVTIGTDGFVGNKVVNITPSSDPAPLAMEGDYLVPKKVPDTDEMLEVLSKTNQDIANIASNLKTTVNRINESKGLWNLLDDQTLPANLRRSAENIRLATARAGSMVNDLNTIVTDIKSGEGSVGSLLRDTAFAANLNEAVRKIKAVGDEADSLSAELSLLVKDVRHDVTEGKGTVYALLRDTAMAQKLNTSLDNIQKGTDGFNQNMEALKHNFLFRGYFRRLEQREKKAGSSNLTRH